jgi:FtsH-binding integral membrane protein
MMTKMRSTGVWNILIVLLTALSITAKPHSYIKSTATIVSQESTFNPRAYTPPPSPQSTSTLSKEPKENFKYERRTLSDFTTRGSRMGFIRKVYAIFSAQMITTIGITAFIMNNPNVQALLYQNFKMLMLSTYLISTGVIFALVSNPELRYKSPVNFILLGIHTVLQSISVGIFSSLLNPRTVCLGTIHTLGTFLAVTLYSFQPSEKYDLTAMGNVLLTSLTSLFIGSILNIFLKMPLFDNILSGALAVLFASYLAYDTQKIVGGKHHKYSYGQKEYILAALNLYQDVINLFIQIMNILNKVEKNGNKE